MAKKNQNSVVSTTSTLTDKIVRINPSDFPEMLEGFQAWKDAEGESKAGNYIKMGKVAGSPALVARGAATDGFWTRDDSGSVQHRNIRPLNDAFAMAHSLLTVGQMMPCRGYILPNFKIVLEDGATRATALYLLDHGIPAEWNASYKTGDSGKDSPHSKKYPITCPPTSIPLVVQICTTPKDAVDAFVINARVVGTSLIDRMPAILNMLKDGKSQSVIGSMLNVRQADVSRIAKVVEETSALSPTGKDRAFIHCLSKDVKVDQLVRFAGVLQSARDAKAEGNEPSELQVKAVQFVTEWYLSDSDTRHKVTANQLKSFNAPAIGEDKAWFLKATIGSLIAATDSPLAAFPKPVDYGTQEEWLESVTVHLAPPKKRK